jgi:hypothetical protein
MYNVFKRPMFKRGGTPAQGTGIMSHVEPRVNARLGYPDFSNATQAPASMRGGLTNFQGSNVTKAPSNLLQYQKLMGGLTPEVEQAPFIEGEEIDSTSPLMSGYKTWEEVPKVIKNLPFTKDLFEARQQDRKQAEAEASARPARDFVDYLNTETPEKEETALEKGKRLAAEKAAAEKPTGVKKALSKEEEIKSEASFIKNLLKDEQFSRGETALILAEALATPGGFNKKLEKVRALALPLVRARNKEDKAVTLEAYKAYKEKEKYQTKYDQPTNTYKDVMYTAGARKRSGDPRPLQDIADEILKEMESGDKKLQKTLLAKSQADIKSDYTTLLKQQQVINNLDAEKDAEKIKKLQKAYGLKLDTFKKTYADNPEFNSVYPTYKNSLGFKDGGRASFALGTDPNESDSEIEDIVSTTVDTFGTETQEKPVVKLTYEELRTRLPKEINDQVVQLISSSEEALQEFAYITTQADVNNFNVKYGVNLIIPPTQA